MDFARGSNDNETEAGIVRVIFAFYVAYGRISNVSESPSALLSLTCTPSVIRLLLS